VGSAARERGNRCTYYRMKGKKKGEVAGNVARESKVQRGACLSFEEETKWGGRGGGETSDLCRQQLKREGEMKHKNLKEGRSLKKKRKTEEPSRGPGRRGGKGKGKGNILPVCWQGGKGRKGEKARKKGEVTTIAQGKRKREVFGRGEGEREGLRAKREGAIN